MNQAFTEHERSSQDRVFFFDTTLRDGEQSPGCSMTIPEKLRMAHALEALGVDIIEAGFAIASDGDSASIRAKIIPNMLKTFPELKDVRIDYTWSGNFALTLTRFPQMGRLSPTTLYSHGDSGHGVTTTHLLGRILG